MQQKLKYRITPFLTENMTLTFLIIVVLMWHDYLNKCEEILFDMSGRQIYVNRINVYQQ